MDHQVDSHYREKHFPKPAAGPSVKKAPTIPTSGDSPSVAGPPPSSLSSRSKEVSDLVASFEGVPIGPLVYLRVEGGDGATGKGEGKGKEKEKDVEVKEVFCPLSTLPYELLLQILRTVALADVAAFARLAQVCKALAYAVMTEQTIWRAVCEKTFSRLLWNWEVDVEGNPLEDSDNVERDPPPKDEEEVTKYGNNWRQMFMMRPRVRFNGIYIATCNYVRAGASQSWNTPVYIVTYYRYLRFYPNGTVLSLLSSSEPNEVVPGFNKASLTPAHLGGSGGPPVGSWSKYVSRGRWRMHGDDLVDVEIKAPMMDRYLFIMGLKIKCVRAKGRMTGVNKLMWGRFWSWNILLDDPTEFSLKYVHLDMTGEEGGALLTRDEKLGTISPFSFLGWEALRGRWDTYRARGDHPRNRKMRHSSRYRFTGAEGREAGEASSGGGIIGSEGATDLIAGREAFREVGNPAGLCFNVRYFSTRRPGAMIPLFLFPQVLS